MKTINEINEYMNLQPELVELFSHIIDIKNGKSTMSDICTGILQMDEKQVNKIDSAYPCDYGKSISEIYPAFYKGYHVYDYNSSVFGEMRNLNNDIANVILKRF
jgi:hypothetical protein